MTKFCLRDAIYKKYIQPTRRQRKSYVGVEFELPLVNLDKQPVDFSVVHQLTEAFIRTFSFSIIHRDDRGDIYSAQSPENDDSLSYDCSYNTLELSFGTETDLHVLYQRFVKYYTFIQAFLKPFHHTLTGMGINPHYGINHNEPIPNGRYRMLFHHLSSYEKYGEAISFHRYPNFGVFSCASQVQLDVEEDNIAETLNTFTKLEPLKSLLFANSLWQEGQELLCARDMLWEKSLHGYNPRNVGLYDTEFHSTEEVVSYIQSMSLYCVEKNGKYINFPPTPLEQYFTAEKLTGEYYDGQRYQTIDFTPAIEDLAYLRSFKLEDLTYRGTVEFRSVCAQPVRDIMAPAAFHAGLLENLSALTELLGADTRLYKERHSPTELRALLNQRTFPVFFDRAEVSALLLDVLALAKDGLEKRGLYEASFLEPLYERAQNLSSPARQMAEGLEAGVPLEHFIEDYGKL